MHALPCSEYCMLCHAMMACRDRAMMMIGTCAQVGICTRSIASCVCRVVVVINNTSADQSIHHPQVPSCSLLNIDTLDGLDCPPYSTYHGAKLAGSPGRRHKREFATAYRRRAAKRWILCNHHFPAKPSFCWETQKGHMAGWRGWFPTIASGRASTMRKGYISDHPD